MTRDGDIDAADGVVSDAVGGAAFFDVDRTLLAGASGLHLARPFRRRGLLTVRDLVRTLFIQLSFRRHGSDHAQLDRFTEGVRELMAGWPHDEVVDVIASELERSVHPMVYREALERIDQHRRLGQPVYAVSATMEEIIVPLAELLGLDGAVATRMQVVDGRFTGEILDGCHGDLKADRLRAFAAEQHIDLERSVAYSDSITDEQFLRAVGRAYAVNPDKALRRLAREEGWGILTFRTPVTPPSRTRRAAKYGIVALLGGLAWRVARRRAAARRG